MIYWIVRLVMSLNGPFSLLNDELTRQQGEGGSQHPCLFTWFFTQDDVSLLHVLFIAVQWRGPGPPGRRKTRGVPFSM